MKVMCINDYFVSDMTGKKPPIHPKVGENVTVIGIKENGFYYLKEYPYNDIGIKCGWNPKKFAPLSDIDETELIKKREDILINQ